jgi:cytochrome c biogenesis protein CcmG/thiol:disulfide interchange protein DsbE
MSKPRLSLAFLGKILNYGIWAVLILLLAQRIPGWVSNFKAEGQPSAELQLTPVKNGETAATTNANNTITLPPSDNQPSVLVFWATWCGPCHLELSRLKEAVQKNQIPANRIFAISIGEDPQTVKDFADKESYPFMVLADPGASSQRYFNINGTPTTYHIQADRTIKWVGTGVSPLSISRAKDLFE